MITNPEIIPNRYRCKTLVMKYLLYDCKIPFLGFDDDYFYFTLNDELRYWLKEMPLHLKLISKFVSQ